MKPGGSYPPVSFARDILWLPRIAWFLPNTPRFRSRTAEEHTGNMIAEKWLFCQLIPGLALTPSP